MLSSIPIWIIVFCYSYKLNIHDKPAFYFNLFFLIFTVFLSFSEGLILTPDCFFIRMDEITFYNEAKQSFSYIVSKHSRYLLYILYSHISLSTSIFSNGEWMLKIQLVPFGILIPMILYDSLRKNIVLWLFPIFMGYFFFLSTLNMRDIIIISSTLFFILKISNCTFKFSFLWFLIAILFYLYIRPEFSLIWSILLFWFVYAHVFNKKYFLAYILPALLIVLLFINLSTNNVFIMLSDFIYPGRILTYLESQSDELSKLPFLNENCAAIIRQIITPLPTSKIRDLITNGTTQNLFFKEIFRIILMTSVYFMFLMLCLKIKTAYLKLKSSKFMSILFIISLFNTILYAIHSDGSGATRNKVYPFILIFCLFCSTYDILFQFKNNNIRTNT